MGASFDSSQWAKAGETTSGNDNIITVAGNKIAIETTSVAIPPVEQFVYTVTAVPLNADGTIQLSVASAEWFKPVEYSSGFTGSGVPNQYILEATSEALHYRWTISIPPQEDAHPAYDYPMVTVFKPN